VTVDRRKERRRTHPAGGVAFKGAAFGANIVRNKRSGLDDSFWSKLRSLSSFSYSLGGAIGRAVKSNAAGNAAATTTEELSLKSGGNV
jgi:hypothetical protein